MPRRTIAAHLPSNYAGPQFERALRSVSWTDHAVVHDASADGSVSDLAKRVRPDVIVVSDRDPDIRARLLRHRDATGDDFLLWVQSDEVWSGAVAGEIQEFLASESPAVGLEVFNESYYFLESFGDRGPYCRVVRRDRLRFPMRSLHDMPDPEGERLVLRSRFLHEQDQNMLLFWVKNYKYSVIEYLRAGAGTGPHPFETSGRIPLLPFLRYVLKINYHFLRGWWSVRHRGLAGLLWAQDLMIRQIATELVPLEAKRLARHGRQYDTAGHFEMPELPVDTASPPSSR
jgi:hypothetical protein